MGTLHDEQAFLLINLHSLTSRAEAPLSKPIRPTNRALILPSGTAPAVTIEDENCIQSAKISM